MNRSFVIVFSLLAAMAGWFWLSANPSLSTQRAANRRVIRFYQDSMHPWVKSSRAGVCSICGMQLVPVFENENSLKRTPVVVTLSSEAATVANVAVETVVRRKVHRALRVSGVFEAQESRTGIVAAPAGGRIDFIAVDHPGEQIHQGDTLVRLFSPDLAQRSRFLRVAITNQPGTWIPPGKSTRASVGGAISTPPPAGESDLPAVGGYRMDAFMSDLTAPITGVVSERSVTLGEYVMEGQKIATVIDPSVLWFRFDAFDRQLRWIAPGQTMEIRTDSAPDKTWSGTVAWLEPASNDLRGLAKARAVVTNTPAEAHSGTGSPIALRPGMFAEGKIIVTIPDVLAVPKSAVIYPGASAWVYVERHSRGYERRVICLGREADDGWEVLSGLREGERVVTMGNVLVDAHAALEMGGAPQPAPGADGKPTPEKANIGRGASSGVGVGSDPYCRARGIAVGTGRRASE